VPAEHEITVVDRTARFHVGAGKAWIMLGERTFEQISQSRAVLLEPGVRFVQADVVGLDLPRRTVSTGAGDLRWDHLVVALGADLNLARVPGLAEAAQTFYTTEGAERLRPALAAFEGGDVVVLIPAAPFKCPPAPYEAAMLLHHALDRRGLTPGARVAIYTVEAAPMATAGPEMSQSIKDELARRGIGFHPQKSVARVDGPSRRITFEDGTEARYDLLIAVPPHEAPKVVRDAQLTNQSGWIPVDPRTLQIRTHAEASEAGAAYAIGDVAIVPLPGRHKPDVPLALPKAGVFAEAQGRVVAHRIAAAILSRTATETFDGRGYCYLETGGGRAIKADGAFFEMPAPVMRRQDPDEAQFRDKLDWVAQHLEPVR
jgi:sulfide:quinone oxidoreductase